jgi:hypothetical protein
LKDASYSSSEIGFLKAQLRDATRASESERLATLQRFLELERQSKMNAFGSASVVPLPCSRVKLTVIKN